MTGNPAFADPPEAGLLLWCARLGEGDTGALLREGLDWEYLLRLADEHGMGPLLYRRLDAGLVPASVMDRLREDFDQNRMRNLLLAGELVQLCRLFEGQGIPVITFKGPSLAAAVYGDLALRKSGDLDILIHHQDVLTAKELLVARGYRPIPQLTLAPESGLTRAQEAAFIHFEREYVFSQDGLDIEVDLQWEIVHRQFSFPLNLERLQKRACRVPLGAAGDVPALPPEVLLLVLCAHGAKDMWEWLYLIRDVAELIEAYPAMDWKAVMEEAGAMGGGRMLRLGLYLAREVSGANLPEEVVLKVRADPVVRELAAQIRRGLFVEPRARGILAGSFFQSFHFKMRERPQDRLRYLLHAVTAPNESDWMHLPLPEYLFALYYLLRPVRLATKYGRRLLKRVPR